MKTSLYCSATRCSARTSSLTTVGCRDTNVARHRNLHLTLAALAVAIGCTNPEQRGSATNACQTSDAPDVQQLSIDTTGSWPRTGDALDFEGWATVERSTTEDWVLYVQPQENGYASVERAAHCHVRSARALPRIAPGARVWLQLSMDAASDSESRLRAGTQLSLRAQEHGALIYSSIHAPGTIEEGLRADALPLLEPRELCSRSAQCILGGRNIVYSLEAGADEPVRVDPGMHAQLMLDGVAQELWLAGASQNQGAPVPMLCGGVLQDERLWVSAEIQVKEWESVTAHLTQGTLPACKLGNDLGHLLTHGVFVGPSGTVEDEAKLRDRLEGTAFVFEFVGTDGALQLDAWPAGWRAPTAGESFWISASVQHVVLRETQHGPILIASGAFQPEATDAELVSQWLGTPVTVEPDCAYERADAENTELFRMRIGAEPGFTLASGSAMRIQLDGQSYDAWMTTERANTSLRIPYIVTRVR